MLRRTPLKRKRTTPRRKHERVGHKRLKRAATSKTAEEAAFMEHVRGLGCLISGKPAVIHHIMHAPGKERRRDHRFIVPLAPEFHNMGDLSVHGLGSEKAFREVWGVDLVGWALAAWSNRNNLDAPFWTDSVTRCRRVAQSRMSDR